ncbi:MAG: hydrogenase nickel incorporation protein HypA [Verrucomicrobia bacterium]|nr:hydrogenase nickel incorporation protein HypA [Verrucomicrobiota bacterium]
MHEWALAEAVIASAAETARQQKMSVVEEIVLNIGELQSIDAEMFASLVKNQLTQAEPLLQDAEVRVVRGEAAFECQACKKEFSEQDAKVSEEEREAIHFVPEMAHVYMRCPACGSPDFSIVRGRGVFIQEITGQP